MTQWLAPLDEGPDELGFDFELISPSDTIMVTWTDNKEFVRAYIETITSLGNVFKGISFRMRPAVNPRTDRLSLWTTIYLRRGSLVTVQTLQEYALEKRKNRNVGPRVGAQFDTRGRRRW